MLNKRFLAGLCSLQRDSAWEILDAKQHHIPQEVQATGSRGGREAGEGEKQGSSGRGQATPLTASGAVDIILGTKVSPRRVGAGL